MSAPESLDLFHVQALVDTRFPDVAEVDRQYFQSYTGHWLVKFLPDHTESSAARTHVAVGVGRPNGCLVNGLTGEIALLPRPDVPLPVGFNADSIRWPEVFPST